MGENESGTRTGDKRRLGTSKRGMSVLKGGMKMFDSNDFFTLSISIFFSIFISLLIDLLFKALGY